MNKYINKIKDRDDSSTVTTLVSSSTLHVPTIKLQRFGGCPESWQTFIENFECAVDKNENLSRIQKMTYLRSLVEGQAAGTITGLTITSGNYTIAIQLLRERYDNKQHLISSHMKNILNID